MNMGQITLKQASEKWNISERRIRRLIQEGRVDGAEKIGNAWNIPEEANKPIDRRYKIDEDNFIIILDNDKELNISSDGIYKELDNIYNL